MRFAVVKIGKSFFEWYKKQKPAGVQQVSVGRTGLEPVTTETNTATSIRLKFSLLLFLFSSFFHGFAPFLRRFFMGAMIAHISVIQFVVLVD